MKSALFTTDLHLTDDPREMYRFGIFDLIGKLVKERQLSYIFILGDLTDKKDNHSSVLVNALTKKLIELATMTEVFILRGNHDCIDPALPFFGFFNDIPNLHYFSQPTKIKLDDTKILMLPHSRDPIHEWTFEESLSQAEITFMHQTLEGSISENGMRLHGMPMEMFAHCKEIYSGDVHVPQRFGNLMYVGSPYHVHFGDQFTPVLRIRDSAGNIEDWQTKMPHRIMLNLLSIDEFDLHPMNPGDQVKIRIQIESDKWGEWGNIQESLRKKCEEAKVELFDITPTMLDNKTVKADSASFLLDQQSPKAVIKKFIENKYPNLTAPYVNVGQELIKLVDGI